MTRPAILARVSTESAVENYLDLRAAGESVPLAVARCGAAAATLCQAFRREGRPDHALELYERSLRPERGKPAPGRPLTDPTDRCKGTCGRIIWRPQNTRPEGSVKHAARGYCSTCRDELVKTGAW